MLHCCDDLALPPIAPNAADLVDIARALADLVRLQIVDLLRAQGAAVCVCDLQPRFDITQPTLSHHLKRLREAGWSPSNDGSNGPITAWSPNAWRCWQDG